MLIFPNKEKKEEKPLDTNKIQASTSTVMFATVGVIDPQLIDLEKIKKELQQQNS